MKRKLITLLLSSCIVLTAISQGGSAVWEVNAANMQAASTEPVVTAGNTIYVDYQAQSTGSGSSTAPYKYLVTALDKAVDGDTIVIKEGGAYVGLETDRELLPLVITKNITIVGEDSTPSLSIRSAGIVLEADVTIRNVTLTLPNKCRAAICANGYRLELENVDSTSTGARTAHLFAGNMNIYDENQVAKPYSTNSGTKGEVIIKGSKTKLGNIYAGSMNGPSDIPAVITVEGTANMQLGDVYASGALEGQYNEDAILDYEIEPTDPTPDASRYPMTGQVDIQVRDGSLDVINGKMNEEGGQADVTFSGTVLENTLELSNIRSLTVTEGELQPSALNEGVNLSVHKGAVLDLSTVLKANANYFTVKDFTGGGVLKMDIADVLTVTGNITGSTEFKTLGLSYEGSSGLVYENHGYIDVSNAQGDGVFTFQSYPTQPSVELKKVDGVWKAINASQEETALILGSLTFSNSEVTADVEEIDAVNGFAAGMECTILEGDIWANLGDIPFFYEVQCFDKTYTQASEIGIDGWYEATIPELNLRFMPNGDDFDANFWIYAADADAQLSPGEYLIKLKAPDANGGVESTLKLIITKDGSTTEPEVPDTSDTTVPTITSLTASEVTAETAVVTATASDDTGIGEYKLVQTAGEGEASILETETKGVFRISGLNPSTDYTFTVTVKDMAGNTSTREVSFTTQEAAKIDLSTATVTVNGTYTYTGSALIPAVSDVVVTLNGSPVDTSQYTITATNNVNAGTATVTIQGQDGYTGSATGTFTIRKAAGAAIAAVTGGLALAQDHSKTYIYTVTEIEGAEYRMDNGAWQAENVFEGIAPGSSHTFFARMKETANTLAGEAKGTEAVDFPVINEGNQEDTTAPVIAAVTATEVTANTAVVSITASDASGIAEYTLVKTTGEGEVTVMAAQTAGVFQLTNLTPSTDYTFTAAVIDGAGNRSTKTVSFRTAEAEKINLSTATVTVNGTYTYTGSALTPAASDVVVTLNGSPVDASQYTITATNNVNAGTATVTIQGQDGYTGSATGTFTIRKAAGAAIAAVTGGLALAQDHSKTYIYTVTEIEGAEYRMDNGAWQAENVFEGIAPGSSHTFFARMKETANTLAGEAKGTEAVDFPVINEGNQEDTTAPVITAVTATEVTANTAVVSITASDASGIAAYTLVKTTGEGEVTVTAAQTAGVFQLTDLTPSTDYTFTATTIDGAGNRSTKTVSFHTAEAEKINLSTATVKVNGTYTYTGSALIPAASAMVVTLNGSLVDASQYTIAVTNNINAGTATVTVQGKDDYTGKATGTFTIGKAAGARLTAVTGSQALAQDGSKTYIYTVTEIEGAEYRMDNGAWQAGNVFKKIAPGSSHTFFARMKETANTLAGEAKSTGAISFSLIDDNEDKEPVQTIDITKIFSDVKEGDWFKDAVAYVYTNKIMTGMGNSDKFGPTGETTRAMVVKILHNAMEGPTSSYKNPFVDVPEEKWYEMPVRWALENGITTGTSPTEFTPDRSVTRQEVASFLYRYGDYRGFDVSMTKDISSYPDQGEISAYARKAMAWANATGIITGKGGIYLDPQGTASRAEIAAMVQRFEARYE